MPVLRLPCQFYEVKDPLLLSGDAEPTRREKIFSSSSKWCWCQERLFVLRSYCHEPVMPKELKKETCSFSRNISLKKRMLNHSKLKYVTGVHR